MKQNMKSKKLTITFHNPNSIENTQKFLYDFLSELILENLKSNKNTYVFKK